MASIQSWPLLSYQPIRTIYLLTSVLLFFARLPAWVVSFWLFRSWRPRPTWTVQQAVLVRLIRGVVDTNSRIGVTEALSLKPGKEKDQFQVIVPFESKFYTGPLESKVKTETIGGTWYPKLFKSSEITPSTQILLHIHGGAFVVGNGRIDTTGHLAKSYIEHAKVDAVFCPQYRLAAYGGKNPFPAALQDIVTSYLYLVRTLKIPPSQITVAGDSAGGNLAIGFLRYLEDFGAQLDIPSPQSCVLESPWVCVDGGLGPDIVMHSNPNWNTDVLPPSFLRWGARTYSQLVPASDPWITPLGHPFLTHVPILLNIGAAEVFEMDCTRWAKEMTRIEGNHVEVNYEATAIHDTILVGGGWDDSVREVATLIGAFIRKQRKN